jgi:hypothetical protein
MTKRTVARGSEPGAVDVRYRPMYARALGLRHLHPGGMLCFVYLEGSIALSLLLALAELVSWWVVLILPVSVALMVKVNDLVAGAVARSAARTPERERERVRREVSAFMPVVGRATVITQSRGATDPADPTGSPGQQAGIGQSADHATDQRFESPSREAVSVPAHAADEGGALGQARHPAAAVLAEGGGLATYGAGPAVPEGGEPHNVLAESGGQATHGADPAAPEGAEYIDAAGLRDRAGRYAAAGRHLDAAWRQHAYAMAHHTEHTDHASQRERQSASRRYE